MNEPDNELDRAFRDAHLGLDETVTYLRLLRDCNLTFLVPYHPEIIGENKIGDSGQLTLTVWTLDGEDVVPVFTSPERADEALAIKGGKEKDVAIGQMPGQELMKAFAPPHNTRRVVVNPGCSCGSRFMDSKMIKSILDGSALIIPTPGEQAMSGLVISLPTSPGQPARLREPLSRFLAGLPEVKAAWLFYEEEPQKPFEKVFVVGLAVVGGDAQAIQEEATLAIAGLCPPEWNSRALIMDANDPGFTDIMRCPPFYRTGDFQPPESNIKK